jgi:hypothetical protein
MISVDSWTISPHQVIKPMMIPYRMFYDEAKSSIPNIYQLRSKTNGSHFTVLRILSYLLENTTTSNPAFVSINKLKAYFAETFDMVEDFEFNVDVLLRHGMVESNNRLDEFTDEVDSIKITPYGIYIYNELSRTFTYLELVCTDCGLFSERAFNYLVKSTNEEIKLFRDRKRLERVKKRLQKANEFIKYLEEEEKREKEIYTLDDSYKLFSLEMRRSFENEKPRVLASAQRHS